MCRRAWSLALVVALAADPGAAGGQQDGPGARPDEAPGAAALEVRLDSLMARVHALAPRVEAEQAAHHASARTGMAEPVERVVEGLRIRALPRDVDAAAALFTNTWRAVFEPAFGPPSEGLADTPLAYYDHRGAWNPRIGEGGRLAHYVQVGEDAGDPEAQAVRALSTALLHRAPAAVTTWIRGFDPRVDRRTVRRQLAAAPSVSAADCLEGDAPACLATLGLRPSGWTPADVVTAWYTPEMARNVVSRMRRVARDHPPEQVRPPEHFLRLQSEYAVPDDDAAGGERIVLLEGLQILHETGPSTEATRASFFLHAVESGGPHALERLGALDPRTPLEDVLTAVSGRSLAELATSWREGLVAHPDPPDGRAPARSTLAWVGLLALFSMTSTRWRLS